jgi:hypothetical protein
MSFSHTTSNVSNAKKTIIYGREFWDFILLDHFNLLILLFDNFPEENYILHF